MRFKKEGKKKRHILLKAVVIMILAAAVLAAGDIVLNHAGSGYSDLSSKDQSLLKEYDRYYKGIVKKPEFEGYSLAEKPVLLMLNGRTGRGYLVNPVNDVKSIFCQKIDMPSDFTINVYRVSRTDPDLIGMRTLESFNTPDMDRVYDESRYHVAGNNVYFVRYTENGSDSELNDDHLTGFLAHEAFHYYMQREWPGGGRYSADLIGKEEIEGLSRKYDILTRMSEKMSGKNPDIQSLKKLAEEYVKNDKERISESPELMKEELAMETAEGSARYVEGIALEIGGFTQTDMDYNKMMGLYRNGSISKDLFTSQVPYYAGAQLCRLMDLLGIKDWQKQLNAQTKSDPVTLYDILEKYVTNVEK